MTERWPRPRRSLRPARAHAPWSSCEGQAPRAPRLKAPLGPTRLSVASTRTGRKSSAIIAAPGAICGLARISHQVACSMTTSPWFSTLGCRFGPCLRACKLRWPRPRGSPGPVRARTPSNMGPAMLSVASTRTEPGSSAIITAPGEKCGLAGFLTRRCRVEEPEPGFDIDVVGGSVHTERRHADHRRRPSPSLPMNPGRGRPGRVLS